MNAMVTVFWGAPIWNSDEVSTRLPGAYRPPWKRRGQSFDEWWMSINGFDTKRHEETDEEFGLRASEFLTTLQRDVVVLKSGIEESGEEYLALRRTVFYAHPEYSVIVPHSVSSNVSCVLSGFAKDHLIVLTRPPAWTVTISTTP